MFACKCYRSVGVRTWSSARRRLESSQPMQGLFIWQWLQFQIFVERPKCTLTWSDSHWMHLRDFFKADNSSWNTSSLDSNSLKLSCGSWSTNRLVLADQKMRKTADTAEIREFRIITAYGLLESEFISRIGKKSMNG